MRLFHNDELDQKLKEDNIRWIYNWPLELNKKIIKLKKMKGKRIEPPTAIILFELYIFTS